MLKKYLILAIFCSATYIAVANDELMRAMRDEIKRSMTELTIGNLEKPYYIEYKVTMGNNYSIRAANGSLIESNNSKTAHVSVGLRVGSYKFDNSNFFDFGLSFFGSGDEEERFKGRSLPVEADYQSLRRELWLATDAAYKQVTETYTKKMTTIKNRVRKDTTYDFLQVPPQKHFDMSECPAFDVKKFENLTKLISAQFNKYSDLQMTTASVEYLPETVYYVNSEGIEYIKTDYHTGVEIVASSQAEDGMPIANFITFFSKNPQDLPSVDSILSASNNLASKISATNTSKSLDEPYSGPIMFDSYASAQLFANVFAPNLVTQREQITDQGFQDNERYTAFQNKIGGRVLPEFISVKEQPLLTKYGNTELMGNFVIDDDGLQAENVDLVDNGFLRSLLSSRVPTKRVRQSNGHQRGGAPMFGNLILSGDKSKTQSYDELKEQMMKLCKDRELPFGIIIKKIMDPNILFTTIFRLTSGNYPMGQFQTSIPVLEAYKISPDGKEELIRGCELKGFTPQSFKDILSVGDTPYALNLLAPAVTSPYISGGSQYVEASVVVPALLFEDSELKPVEQDFPKLPFLKNPLTMKK